MADDGTSNASSSDPNPCPICLAPFSQGSYLDQCFHKFCYQCIVKWINIISRGQSRVSSSVNCPLCKRENFSILCGYDGYSFQEHYIGKSLGNSEFFSEAHRYRLKCYYFNPGDLADKLHVPRYWKLRKFLQQNQSLPDWLRREIQAVLQEEDVDIIMHHILGVIDSLRRNWSKEPKIATERMREEFKVSVSNAVRPFLRGRTERFVEEVELFLASGLNITAFDQVYIKHLGWKCLGNKENKDNPDEPVEHRPTVPYLYILDALDLDDI